VACPKDYTEALALCRKAAEADDPHGMALLGAMYESGTGVSKDLAQARTWYEKAADRHNSFAQERLKKLNTGGKAK
jgi:uncharacterized protein